MSTNGSRIITREREAEERLIRQAKRIDAQHPTIGEVKEIIQELFGPLALLLREVCVRQQLIEDHFRLTFVPATENTTAHFTTKEPERTTIAQAEGYGIEIQYDPADFGHIPSPKAGGRTTEPSSVPGDVE